MLITFIEDNQEDELREIFFAQTSRWFKDYLEDSREDLYHYLKKK